ncbi:BamA/TamA family outer membrane protein [Novosphingobium sp. PhB165]|uniref:autotransporter assembly complex protein TamA n=1 Tax=Novosphingobium sp. PhB165 TaxID=2485105 RepID=UPI003260FF63
MVTLALMLAASGVPAYAQDADPSASPPTGSAPQNTAAQAGAQAGAQNAGNQPARADDSLQAGKLDVPAPPADVTLPEVKPIIPDDEFNKSIPKLDATDDPELDKPLDSIEEFEKRLTAQQAQQANQPAGEQANQTAAGGASTATVTATAPAPSSTEAIGEAPVRDPELMAPLPPIDQFEVTPVQFAESEQQSKDSEIAYAMRVDGLDAADQAADIDLRGEFRSHSALKKGDGKAANVAMLRSRLNDDAALMQTVLAAEGWYSPVITTRIERGQGAERGAAFTAVITVDPGKRYVFSDIVVKADPTIPPNLIADNFALKVGEPIIAQRVQGAEAQVALALPENGYAFAQLGDRDILLDQDTGDGVYTLPIDVGPRGRFGGFTTSGDLAFDEKHIRVLARFKPGELYDSRKVDDLRKALVATSLFSTVSVEPRKTGESAGDDGTEYVTLHVQQDAGPPRTIAGTIGYATGEGLSAQAIWTHRNMFPPEGAVIVNGTAGTRQQGLSTTFRRSNAGKRDRTLEVVAEAFHNDYDAYSAYTGRIAVRMARDSTPLWQKKFTYAYGAEALITGETDYNIATGTRDRKLYYVVGVNGQAGFDHTDSLLDPTKGFRFTALVQPEATVKGGFNPYVRSRLDGSAYYPVTDSLVLAGRFRLGSIQGAQLFDIAPSRRLYAGGGGSVRGYSYQALGEQAPDGKAVGGRSLNEASVEARYRFGNFGVVTFVDAGQAYRETTPQFNNLRYGVGIGGRYYTNFGPVRIDIATPIDRQPGESRFNLYVSIGQAF